VAGMGPPPKVDDERRRRNAPTFGWVDLPREGRKGKPPALPKWRMWDQRTVHEWTQLWAKPQATQWDQTGSTLFVWACLIDDLVTGRADATKVSAELRQHEDRHGLSTKAMLNLRWRLAPDEVGEARKGRGKKAAAPEAGAAARARLRAVKAAN
jgi:hypothetical protein